MKQEVSIIVINFPEKSEEALYQAMMLGATGYRYTYNMDVNGGETNATLFSKEPIEDSDEVDHNVFQYITRDNTYELTNSVLVLKELIRI